MTIQREEMPEVEQLRLRVIELERELCQGARLRLLADAVPAAIAYIDRDGRYRFTNQAYAARHGVRGTGLLGEKVEEILDKETYLAMADNVRTALSGQSVEFEHGIGGQDGQSDFVGARYIPDVGNDGGVRGFFAVDKDLTESGDTKNALRASEARFRAFMENSPVDIYLKDLDGRHIMLSRQSENLFGREAGATGKTAHDLFPKEYADDYVAHDRAVIDSGQTITREHVLPTRQGLRKFLVTKFPVPGSDSQISAIGAIATDITIRNKAEEALQTAHDELEHRVRERTRELSNMNIALEVQIEERKRTERALRESESRVRAIADAFPSKIAYVDREQRYRFNNAAYAQWHGLSSEDCLGAHVRDVIGATNYETAEPYIERVLAGHEVNYEYFTAEGKFADVHFIPDFDEQGQVRGFYGLVHDVTKAKEAKRALRENLELLATIINTASIGINVKGPDCRYVFMNRFLAETYGIEAAQAVGMTPSDLRGAETGDPIMERDRQVFETGEVFPYREEKTTDKDGRERIWLTTRAPVKHDDGSVKYIVNTSLDITDIKARESELRQAQKMEAVGQLTGGIAHDFNNLLFVIQGNLVSLEAELEGFEKALKLVGSIQSAVTLGSDLTRSLLAFSRQQPLQPTVIDTCETIRSTTAMLSRTIGEEVQIKLLCDDHHWPVLIDRGQLEIALLNLALNARDAMPEGGELTISVANFKQPRGNQNAESSPPEGDYVEFKVSDTGIGMSTEVVDQCFEPFYTTKPAGSGTGLGLSMVYGFIKQSGGFIEIESESDKGTTVTMYLPRAKQRGTSGLAVRSELEETKGGQETILVTEDDAEVRRLAVGFLNRLGYRTLEAGDGNEALEILAREPDVHLLFIDIVMPGGLNGYELASLSQQRLPDLKVLFCSGHPEAKTSPGDVIERAAPLIAKPYKPDDLGRIVRRMLDERRESPIQ